MLYTFPAPVINTLTSPDGASQKKARTEVNWLENCKTAGSWQTSVKKRRLTPNLETLLSLDQWCLPKIRQQCISYHRIICTWFVFVMRYGWSSVLCPTESRLTSSWLKSAAVTQKQPWPPHCSQDDTQSTEQCYLNVGGAAARQYPSGMKTWSHDFYTQVVLIDNPRMAAYGVFRNGSVSHLSHITPGTKRGGKRTNI